MTPTADISLLPCTEPSRSGPLRGGRPGAIVLPSGRNTTARATVVTSPGGKGHCCGTGLR